MHVDSGTSGICSPNIFCVLWTVCHLFSHVVWFSCLGIIYITCYLILFALHQSQPSSLGLFWCLPPITAFLSPCSGVLHQSQPPISHPPLIPSAARGCARRLPGWKSTASRQAGAVPAKHFRDAEHVVGRHRQGAARVRWLRNIPNANNQHWIPWWVIQQRTDDVRNPLAIWKVHRRTTVFSQNFFLKDFITK